MRSLDFYDKCAIILLIKLYKEAMEQFKWQLATLEELVEKYESDTRTFGQQQHYYRKVGNGVMSEKMVKAKKLALIKRLQEGI